MVAEVGFEQHSELAIKACSIENAINFFHFFFSSI